MNQKINPPFSDLSEVKSLTIPKFLADAIAPSLLPYSEALLEAQARFVQFAQSFTVALDAAHLAFKPFLEDALPVLQRIVETDWAAVLDAHEKSFLHMADCGWTLPDWIALQDLHALYLKSPEELDRFFVDGFMANDAENLKELGITLKAIPRLFQWHPLIDDIIASILAGNHRVAIPATLTVMDGYLASAVVNASLAEPGVTSPVKKLQKAKWHEFDTTDAVFWKAGLLFLGRVFADSNFAHQPPTFINRHWILHGRASVDWSLSDALRLVNSLTTLDFLFEKIGQPKLNAPMWRGNPNEDFAITPNLQTTNP